MLFARLFLLQKAIFALGFLLHTEYTEVTEFSYKNVISRRFNS
jgi:hypothetical protein